MKGFTVLLFILTFFYRASLFSQTCCSGGVPVSGSIGLFPLSERGLQFNLSYDINSLKTLKNFSRTLQGANRERLTHSILLETSYTITDRFSLYGLVSYVTQRREIRDLAYEDTDITSGVGDAVIMPGYLLVDGFSFSWLLSAGIKLPLGKTGLRDQDGILLNPDLQPGSGAFDALFLNMFRYEAARGHSFWNTLAFRRTGTNKNFRSDDNYRFGNELVTSMGWSKTLFIFKSIVEPSLITSYRLAERDLINNKEIPNTGGNWLFVSTGISLYIRENLKIFSAFTFPLYSEPSGVQLTTSYRFNMGIHLNILNNENRYLKF